VEWSDEALRALDRVPFFVRKRVRARVEEEARARGADLVTAAHLETCRRRFLKRMEDEVKGYRVETCFGPGGCPNRAVVEESLAPELERRLARKDLKGFLLSRVRGPLKMHHEFQVSVSDCPNACSRPQIADIGLIGAREPRITDEACSLCAACVEICREKALSLNDAGPVLDSGKCLACGQCIEACPTGTLKQGARGYRVLAGGKLGRHPRLASDVGGIFDTDRVLEVVERVVGFYMRYCREGERLGEILRNKGPDELAGFVGNGL